MRGNSRDGKGKGLLIVFLFSFFRLLLLLLELVTGKKICDCSFINFTVSKDLNCGWQQLLKWETQ